jgi:hypothetical protein
MCLSCTESINKCTKCADLRINEPTCECPFGYLDDLKTPMCKKCAYNCLTCT